MINRLLIRTKTVQLVYACLQSQEQMYADEKLMEAVEASQKLYNYLLALIVKVTDFRHVQIESARSKWLPSQADLNPNMRLVNNRVARLIKEGNEVVQFCEDEHLTSDFDTELYRTLLEAIEQSEAYQNYASQTEEPTFEQDRDLWVELLQTVIPQCEKLDEVLEDRNVYWNDDLTTVLQAVVRAIKNLKPSSEMVKAAKTFNSETDRKFAVDLFHYALKDYYDNVRLINAIAPNWESERMALMDKIVMACALAEIKHFPEIATAISINEYLELSKHYCSAKSSRFINGVLDKIVKQWKDEGLLSFKL